MNEVKPLYIVVGLSGAGKSTALRVFEDHRFFAVDGLPAKVVPEVAAIMTSSAMGHFSGMAIGLDIRQNDFLEAFSAASAKLNESGILPKIIYLEADDAALIHRFAATRRPHPLETDHSGLEAAIYAERQLLERIRQKADLVINTTSMSIHDLRRYLQQEILGMLKRKLKINILSFGFKNGIPQDTDFVFDLRFLSNPYFVETLREKSGRDGSVAEYIFSSQIAVQYARRLQDLLFFILSAMEAEGRYRVTISFGCTGGRHRSVAFAERIAKSLQQSDYPVDVTHRDIEKI